MPKKKSVLHIITHLGVGGAQDNTLYTLERLDRTKYKVSLAANIIGEYEQRVMNIDGLDIIHLPYLKRKINIVNDIVSLFQLYKIIKKNSYDIVHTHSTKPGVLGRIAAKLAKTPVIIHTVHGFAFHDFMPAFLHKIYILLEKCMNLLTDHLITVSTLNGKKMISLNLARSEDITNVYSGIDLEKFEQDSDGASIRDELGIDQDMRLVGFIGRFSHQKDPLCLLKAVKRTVKECLNVHFLLVGGGELKSEMVDFISQNDLGKIVTVWDFRQDINNILNALDLFVISSIYEGLGRSLTEAMAKGIPVVATAVEGVPEIVQHNATGRLVPPRNSKELSKMIICALENKPQSLYMAVKGKKWVYEKFSVDKMVKDIDNVYQRLISLS